MPMIFGLSDGGRREKKRHKEKDPTKKVFFFRVSLFL